jgi:hypothetical protein
MLEHDKSCCGTQVPGGRDDSPPEFLPLYKPTTDDDACCGPPAGPPSGPHEKAGYAVWHFVEDFIATPAGPVPRVATHMARPDMLHAVKVRLGIGRNSYNVAPGLYCAGHPDSSAPVLVTANYKLSFDTLRCALSGVDAWLLVIDTRGINVWCAAGKGTFSTQEVVLRIKQVFLEKIVQHRRIILPQLAATGVSARHVKKKSGFDVVWGPVRAGDIKAFLASGHEATPRMRRVTFSLAERLVLIPVEFSLAPKYVLWTILGLFVLSGIGPHIFSFELAWTRGRMTLEALIGGMLAGAVAVPALLPWIPGAAFAVKGALTGLVAGTVVAALLWSKTTLLESLALLLCTAALSSFMAMNFTGSTPYTSPSGVEKEMRKAIPLQALAGLIALVAWIGVAFAG